MANPTIRIHDLATDKVVDREMTKEEFDKWSAQKIIDEKKTQETLDKVAARQAVYAKLGLTADEIAALAD